VREKPTKRRRGKVQAAEKQYSNVRITHRGVPILHIQIVLIQIAHIVRSYGGCGGCA
jgi:hypothetical protein